MDNSVKVGFCIAYDWAMLEYALPMVYEWADLICLSLDRHRRSWAGNVFPFDEASFRSFVKRLDTQGKVRIYEDDFFVSDLTPMQNEVRQRNRMASFMKSGGWHIQLDCDEYFVDFDRFVKYLASLGTEKRTFNVCCHFVTLFKEVQGGFLYVLPQSAQTLEYIQIATRTPDYQFGRRNGAFNYYTNYKIIHQSWARTDEEISRKIGNWGHVNDFGVAQFQLQWRNLSSDNYQDMRDFHPIEPKRWSSLSLLKVNSVCEISATQEFKQFPAYSTFELFLKNSRLLSKIRALWKKIF